MRSTVILLFLLSVSASLTAQYTRQDSLRGTITAERAWWDLTYYHLDIKVDPEGRTIKGSNTIYYKVLSEAEDLQIDLQKPMHIERVSQDGETLEIVRDGNAWFVSLVKEQVPGTVNSLLVEFGGKPQVSENPPWSGGITWKQDPTGKPFIASAVQGKGASLWWPVKDHMYDEPDSMLISVTVPKGLMDVSNGRLRDVTHNKDGTNTYHWYVDNPINNYGVSINIADYVHFSERYDGLNGKLDCDYYVLRRNLSAAKDQFKQVSLMLEAFEHWFGPYPFYEDGFKLIEAPYLGMEHQSAVTYGNGYQNGYRGLDLSRTGWGLKFDFIIIHESGHEWFANNITYKDIADMWIHESFTAYSENLYLNYHFGEEASSAYVRGTRININNDEPIIGPYGVNQRGSGDMYYKGANMLHMIRQIIGDDEKWREILRGLNKTFYHQTVETSEIENYISKHAGMNLQPIFDQYLRDVRIPILEYYFLEGYLYYRWTNVISDFALAVPVSIDGTSFTLAGTTQWNRHSQIVKGGLLTINPDYYVGHMEIGLSEVD